MAPVTKQPTAPKKKNPLSWQVKSGHGKKPINKNKLLLAIMHVVVVMIAMKKIYVIKTCIK